ncbi:MAG: hypothetical protein GX489_00465 [Firmicutes bacterium]|nr:hypothetical protein [Bacillota bacterium]
MNDSMVESREQELKQEIIELKAKIDKLRLGRRILMNLLVLQEQQQLVQLQELELMVSSLKEHNAKLRKMLLCKD